MNELIDYVIHKFLLLAEEKPVSCAITLLGESSCQTTAGDMLEERSVLLSYGAFLCFLTIQTTCR